MITIFSRLSDLSGSYVHTFITMNFIFKNVFILFCSCLCYFSYIVIFTQQHKNNITNSDKK
jgi:hypothetical protein